VAKVTVYNVQVCKIMTGQLVLSRRMATREGATIMKGEIIDNTAVEIDETQLESGEKWTPIDFRPQDRRLALGKALGSLECQPLDEARRTGKNHDCGSRKIRT